MDRSDALPVAANPWLELPLEPPFVLPQDLAAAQAQKVDLNATFKLQEMPEPYFGSPEASVVMLLLNPSWDEGDVAVHRDPAFRAAMRQSYRHTRLDYPFIHLARDGMSTPAKTWWTQHARELIEATSIEAVSSNLLCLEFMGYKTKEYKQRGLRLPSQQYTFGLLRNAIMRGAMVLVMRSEKDWYSAVPELITHENKAFANTPRRPYLSKGNFAPGVFERIVERIATGS